jgi:hypothetical protein
MSSEPGILRVFPNQLLSQCLTHVKIERFAGWLSPESKTDIHSVRLVCRDFNVGGAPLLVSSVRVDITSESLCHIEELSRRPLFSKPTKQVEVNVSYYDACVVNDLALFARLNSTELYQLFIVWKLVVILQKWRLISMITRANSKMSTHCWRSGKLSASQIWMTLLRNRCYYRTPTKDTLSSIMIKKR